jgi:hypothetical protein
MPKRVLDFDALWASDKIAACAEWAQAEYAWIYGLADANGSFELTNLRVPWSKVAAIRRSLSLERFEQIIEEFHDKGLLFIWAASGKRYGHWTGSDKPGRLPRESRRTPRYGPIFAPTVPQKDLATYATECASRCDGKGVTPSNSDVNLAGTRSYCDSNPVDGLGLGLGLGVGVGEKKAHRKNGAPAAQAAPRPSPSSVPAFVGSHFSVTEKQDGLLATAFPWVDRQVEYCKADSWLEANPNRRPRKSSHFLHNWFSRISEPQKKGAKGETGGKPKHDLNEAVRTTMQSAYGPGKPN